MAVKSVLGAGHVWLSSLYRALGLYGCKGSIGPQGGMALNAVLAVNAITGGAHVRLLVSLGGRYI